MTDRVICETCGEDTWSADYPCSNCDTNPPVTDWNASSVHGFRFERAMKAMRLGMKARRKAEPQNVFSIEGDDILCNGKPLSAHEGSALDRREIMAEDWEVVS